MPLRESEMQKIDIARLLEGYFWGRYLHRAWWIMEWEQPNLYQRGWSYYIPPPPLPLIDRAEVEHQLALLRKTRLAPFLRKAGLDENSANLSEEVFHERLLRLRCYLAEPDEPSEELLNRLKLVMRLSSILYDFLTGVRDMLELKRALYPLRKSLVMVAPELHPLLYSIAEQFSLVGEHSPEDKEQLLGELTARCAEWLLRLYYYWRAVLG